MITIKEKEFNHQYQQTLKAFKLGDYSQALRLVDNLMEPEEERWPMHLLRGNIESRLKHYDEALDSYQRVLDLSPENVEALNNLGILYRLRGEYEDSARCLDKALEQSPDRADILYNKGNLAKAMGRFNEAIKDYNQVIRMASSFTAAYNNLGTIYMSREDYKEAAEAYDQGLLQDPLNASLLYNRGVLYQTLEKWDKAEEYFSRALESKPGWEDCRNNLGIILQEKGALEEAKKIFHEILLKDRKNPRVLNNMGVVLTQLGQDSAAESYYTEALDMTPEYRNASLNLNKLYSHKKDYNKALKEMNRLATLYPFDLEVRNEIGQALIRLNQLKEAEDTFQHVLERDPENRQARKDLAELHIRRGDEAKGWELLESIGLNDFMEDGEAVLRVADAFRKNGNNEKAEELLSRYEDYAPGDERVRRRLSRIYEDEERWDESLEMLKMLDSNDDPDILTRSVQMNLKKGNKTEALQGMDQLMSLQSERGTADDLDQFREFLDLYEETTSSILEESGANWEQNLEKLSRTLRSLNRRPVPEEEIEDYRLNSFSSQALSIDDSLTLLDINAMEPIIEINEDREVLYIEDQEEDFSDIYTEVMEEEQRKREKEYQEQRGYPPPFSHGQPPVQPQQPIIIPMPQQMPMTAPQVPPSPPLASETTKAPELTPAEAEAETALPEDDGAIGFEDEEEILDEEIFIPEEELSRIERLEKEEENEEAQLISVEETIKEQSSQEEEMTQPVQTAPVQSAPPVQALPIQINLAPPSQTPVGQVPAKPQVAQQEKVPEEPAKDEILDLEELWVEEELPVEELPAMEELPVEEEPPVAEKLPAVEKLQPSKPLPEAALEEILPAEQEPSAKSPADAQVNKKSLASMFKYLSDLTESLPEQKKEEMIEKEVPLRMEVVRSKLEGERSLLHTAAHYDRRSRDRIPEMDIDDEKLSHSLSFLKDMAHQYPDQKVSKNFDKKMEKLLDKIRHFKGPKSR